VQVLCLSGQALLQQRLLPVQLLLLVQLHLGDRQACRDTLHLFQLLLLLLLTLGTCEQPA
jgi:hypothetical protein